jgi:hypothetical protein
MTQRSREALRLLDDKLLEEREVINEKGAITLDVVMLDHSL